LNKQLYSLYFLKLLQDMEEEHSKSKWILNSDESDTSARELESKSEERDTALKALSHYTSQESWISSQSK